MTAFIFNGICSLVNSFRQKLGLWPNEVSAKRRRDSVDEDEEDDIIFSCQSLSKRPKWYPPKINMASDSSVRMNDSAIRINRGHIPMKVYPGKRSIHKRPNPEIKENGADVVEVIEIDSGNNSPVEARPPLSDLVVRTKNKSQVEETVTMSRPSRRNHVQAQNHKTERRQNGVHPRLMNTFTSPIRRSNSSVIKQTAINETFKIEDRLKYSQLLEEYNRSKINLTFPARKNGALVNDTLKPTSSYSRSMDVIDLTAEDRFMRTRSPEAKSQKVRLPVKPWEGASSSSSDNEVTIVEEYKLPRVNSLEKQLSQNSLVSPQWIIDMQLEYSEREREKRRQIAEASMKKELYAQHNHKKILESLDARIKKHLQITDVVLDDTEEVPVLPTFTAEMNAKVDAALKPNPPREVLVEGFGQRITRHDIQTLNKLNWLNDEVMNFYMNLLIERGKQDKKLSVYAFNTFFYPKLVSQGYSSLRRWTKKVDIFSHELLLVPVHLGMHWCMATIDFRDKTVRYYDSMGSANNQCLTALLQYLNEESLDKKKAAYNTTDWNIENVKDIPQQMNGSDCGMFSCMFAEYLSRNAKITFSQKDMPYFRRKMVLEIITKTLLQ